jgi:hypothetical protein
MNKTERVVLTAADRLSHQLKYWSLCNNILYQYTVIRLSENHGSSIISLRPNNENGVIIKLQSQLLHVAAIY